MLPLGERVARAQRREGSGQLHARRTRLPLTWHYL